jgi:general secretion pathway protein D
MRRFSVEQTRLRLEATVCGLIVGLLLVMAAMLWAQPPPGSTPGRPTSITVTRGTSSSSSESGEPKSPTEGSDEKKDDEKKTEEGPVAVFIPEAPDGDKLISMSFDQADIDHVLKFMAEQSGKTIVKEPSVQTKVTIVSTAKITVADAFRILSALLAVKGYSLIEDDTIIRVVPQKNALKEPMEVRTAEGPVKRADQYVTHILQVEYIDAKQLQDDLKPLIPDEEGHLIANADTNTLVIIGPAATVSRVLEVIKALDTDRTEVTAVEVIKLDFADAEELAEELNNLFERESPMAGLPPDVRRRIQEAMRRAGGSGGEGGAVPGLPQRGLLDVRGDVKIVAETRTNSVMVSASDANIQIIKDIVAKVDVDMRPEVQAQIVPLEYADATTLADQINQLYEESSQFSRRGGSMFSSMFRPYYSSYGRSGSAQGTAGLAANRVVPDVRTNSLIVTADEDNMPQILSLVKDLDVPSEIQEVVQPIPLENAVAEEVAQTINNLIQGTMRGRGFFFFSLMGGRQGQGGEAPLDQLQRVNVVADSPTNTILLSGPPETFETLERLIKQLDRQVPQVYIQVLIADITLDKSNRLGIEWSLIDKNLLGHSSATGQLGTTFEGLAQAVTGLSYSLISNSIQGFLRTLDTRGDVEILSSPNIVAADNTPATISIGEQIPYQESTRETTGGSIQQTTGFVDVANTLEVTPHVNQRERITLEVTQTVDALIGFDEKLLAPRVAKRTAETTVEVRDGQTIVIGGIISKQKSVTIQGVPILRKIPIIGPLFEDKKKEESRSELLVFLTPHIILDDAQVDALTEGQSRRMTINPLDDEEMRPLDLPPAPRQNREMPSLGAGGPASPEAPAPEAPAPPQP